MPLIRQKKKPPGWGTRFARSFAEQLPGVAGNVLHQALGGLVQEQFRKAAEQRKIAARKEQEQREEERRLGREKRAEERFRGAEERGAERRTARDVGRVMAPIPEEQTRFMGAPKEYQAPTTRATGEAIRGIAPQFMRGAAGALAGVPLPKGEVGAKRPDFWAKDPDVEGVPELGKPKGLGLLDLPKVEAGPSSTTAPTPGGIAGIGGEAMAKAATAPLGTLQAGAREAGIAMKGKKPVEPKLTAKQREARDPLIRKRQLQSLWDKMLLTERRLHAQAQYQGFQSQQDRNLLESITESRNMLNKFVIGGVVQPGVDLPAMDEVPFFRLMGGGGGRRPGRQGPGAPPPGVDKKEWIDVIRAARRRGKTPQQAREDYRKKYGK